MTIAVIGVGAIGATFAAELWNAGRRDLVFCVREALPSWTVVHGDRETMMTPRALIDPAAAPAAEWVLLATKAHQTDGAARWLRRVVRAGTRVAVLQNGIDHEARVAPLCPDAAIVPVIVQSPAERVAPGRVVVPRAPQMIVRDDDDARRFAELFARAGTRIEHRADFVTALWEKLCVNAVGGIAALVDAPLDLREPELADLARRMLREIVQVARAEGARLDDAIVEDIVGRYRHPGRPNSILADRRAGRALEVDARNAVIVRRARQHGIDAPSNQAVSAMLRALSDASTRPT